MLRLARNDSESNNGDDDIKFTGDDDDVHHDARSRDTSHGSTDDNDDNASDDKSSSSLLGVHSSGRAPKPRTPITFLDVCVSSLRRGQANLLGIVPILTDDPRRES